MYTTLVPLCVVDTKIILLLFVSFPKGKTKRLNNDFIKKNPYSFVYYFKFYTFVSNFILTMTDIIKFLLKLCALGCLIPLAIMSLLFLLGFIFSITEYLSSF